MDMEGSPQVTRRTTRSCAVSSNDVESTKPSESYKPTLNDLAFGKQPFGLEDLLSRFPCRRTQILEFLRLLGPLNSPLFPVLVYGGPSTGKTSVTLQDSKHSYSSVKRCERPSDFVNYLREALENVISSLKGNSGKSNSKMSGRPDGTMMPEVGLIFISNISPDMYYLNIGYVEPIPLYFLNYTEDDLRHIFMVNQTNRKLYASFLDVVLRPFCRVTRRVDELAAALSSLFKKYCEPLSDKEVAPNEEMKRKLFSQIRPHISSALNETFQVRSQPLLGAEANKTKKTNSSKMSGILEDFDKIDFHMSTSAKYLLISAFLASRNPATLDASLFDSTGVSDSRKRKRKASEKSMDQKEMAEQELHMKGPGTFPLERLLAIFQCITSLAEDSLDEEESRELTTEGSSRGLMSDVLLQLSSLCNANFIIKGGSCPLEGSTRYRTAVSEDLALKVARSLKFPLSKYLYRR
ncbi:Origin of replication complex subunit 5 [Hibiscus syriacus]|uniref:Origin of replication complex subunit 5 n=1 Tax=Hibiscus syriacus TaxID=106335 RepID=A0A6A3A0A6_HIBSY|nr:Origin of replication complex subunit 5 [Hibiscus syriacus]